jgi:hypothetical protein
LLALLEAASEKEGIEPFVIALEREPWSAGELAPATFESQKPKSAINTLADEIQKARRVWESEGDAAYQPHAQAICAKLRKTLERMVEDDLLAGVIPASGGTHKQRTSWTSLRKFPLTTRDYWTK